MMTKQLNEFEINKMKRSMEDIHGESNRDITCKSLQIVRYFDY